MPPSFTARLRQSHLWKWAVAYFAFAWLFLQALDLIGDNFGMCAIVADEVRREGRAEFEARYRN